MKDLPPFVFPEITEEDIAWACRAMGLPEGAFDQARQNVLLDRSSIDVAACPGSGKTTLLVTKLAIMARKWMDARRGICVLSHTNVARNEIEQRLGATAEGQALLSYPHFIGTIHGFIDRFLGMPYLRHKQWNVLVDNDECFRRIEGQVQYVPNFSQQFKNSYRKLNHRNQNAFYRLELSYSNENVEISPRCSANHLMGFPRGTTIDDVSYFQKRLKLAVSRSGFHTFNDMFVFGHRLIDSFPEACSQLVERFPVLFIDEAQDTSEMQSNILHRVFVEGGTGVVCQRFGDDNQAIFHSPTSQDTPTTWVFPNNDIKRDISDSHRFGQTIAAFAAPLAVEPQELMGRGPDQRRVLAEVDNRHTVFLFEDDAREQVLPVFADYLRSIFPNEALDKGSFVAVGGKHKQPDNDDNKPNSVCDYWNAYVPEQSKADPRPDTFVGYVQAGRSKMEMDGNRCLFPLVDSIASGILEAARRSGGNAARQPRKDRHIRKILAEKTDALASYNEFLRRFAADGEELTPQMWRTEWKQKIKIIAEAVFEGEAAYQEDLEFFGWPNGGADAPANVTANIVYQKDEQLPKIRLGSIHSVKGETHTGVLVFETFIRSPMMGSIKRWLLGNIGTERQRDRQSRRLKLHYVAMTRSTHLLCLALPTGTFSDEEEITTLIELGWQIARVSADGKVEWQDPPDNN